jgi:hypothetical protein
MMVTLYRHPFDEPNGASVNRYVAVADNEWFEVPGTPSGGWRLRRPYFGPRSGLLPVAEPMARELRRALGDPFYP